ncbi:MAG: hypothetical protein AB8H80_01510 [Planctomycetota bacterium]
MPPRTLFKSLAAAAFALAAAVFPTATLLAQNPQASQRAHAGSDPYAKKGDANPARTAGYVRYGPFPFGHEHTSTDVEALLGTEPLIWIETEHFRLGCALAETELSGSEPWRKEWRKRVMGELRALHEVLPLVPLKPRRLDPWLRAHLYAHRLEAIYAEARTTLGVAQDWFPNERGDRHEGKVYRGDGPHFGMAEKFTVLLLQRASSHARYTHAYHGSEMAEPLRVHDQDYGNLYWGASEETGGGLFGNDLALHSQLVFNIAHNIYSGYRAHSAFLPAWLITGLSHHHARRISKRYPTFDRRDDSDTEERSPFWAWEERVSGLARHEVFVPLDDFFEVTHAGEYTIEQHMHCWALVEWLLKTHRQETVRWLHELSEPLPFRGLPSTAQILRWQRTHFVLAFDLDIADVDQKFRADVGKKRHRY